MIKIFLPLLILSFGCNKPDSIEERDSASKDSVSVRAIERLTDRIADCLTDLHRLKMSQPGHLSNSDYNAQVQQQFKCDDLKAELRNSYAKGVNCSRKDLSSIYTCHAE